MKKTLMVIGLIVLIGLCLQISPVLSICSKTLTVPQGTHIVLSGPEVKLPSNGYIYQWSSGPQLLLENGSPLLPSDFTGKDLVFDAPTHDLPYCFEITLLVTDVDNHACVNSNCVQICLTPYCCPLIPSNFCADNPPASGTYPASICYPPECITTGLWFSWVMDQGTGSQVILKDKNSNACVDNAAAWASASNGVHTLTMNLWDAANPTRKLYSCEKNIYKIPVPDNTVTTTPPA
jgi:hypothetical protein